MSSAYPSKDQQDGSAFPVPAPYAGTSAKRRRSSREEQQQQQQYQQFPSRSTSTQQAQGQAQDSCNYQQQNQLISQYPSGSSSSSLNTNSNSKGRTSWNHQNNAQAFWMGMGRLGSQKTLMYFPAPENGNGIEKSNSNIPPDSPEDDLNKHESISHTYFQDKDDINKLTKQFTLHSQISGSSQASQESGIKPKNSISQVPSSISLTSSISNWTTEETLSRETSSVLNFQNQRQSLGGGQMGQFQWVQVQPVPFPLRSQTKQLLQSQFSNLSNIAPGVDNANVIDRNSFFTGGPDRLSMMSHNPGHSSDDLGQVGAYIDRRTMRNSNFSMGDRNSIMGTTNQNQQWMNLTGDQQYRQSQNQYNTRSSQFNNDNTNFNNMNLDLHQIQQYTEEDILQYNDGTNQHGLGRKSWFQQQRSFSNLNLGAQYAQGDLRIQNLDEQIHQRGRHSWQYQQQHQPMQQEYYEYDQYSNTNSYPQAQLQAQVQPQIGVGAGDVENQSWNQIQKQFGTGILKSHMGRSGSDLVLGQPQQQQQFGWGLLQHQKTQSQNQSQRSQSSCSFVGDLVEKCRAYLCCLGADSADQARRKSYLQSQVSYAEGVQIRGSSQSGSLSCCTCKLCCSKKSCVLISIVLGLLFSFLGLIFMLIMQPGKTSSCLSSVTGVPVAKIQETFPCVNYSEDAAANKDQNNGERKQKRSSQTLNSMSKKDIGNMKLKAKAHGFDSEEYLVDRKKSVTMIQDPYYGYDEAGFPMYNLAQVKQVQVAMQRYSGFMEKLENEYLASQDDDHTGESYEAWNYSMKTLLVNQGGQSQTWGQQNQNQMKLENHFSNGIESVTCAETAIRTVRLDYQPQQIKINLAQKQSLSTKKTDKSTQFTKQMKVCVQYVVCKWKTHSLEQNVSKQQLVSFPETGPDFIQQWQTFQPNEVDQDKQQALQQQKENNITQFNTQVQFYNDYQQQAQKQNSGPEVPPPQPENIVSNCTTQKFPDCTYEARQSKSTQYGKSHREKCLQRFRYEIILGSHERGTGLIQLESLYQMSQVQQYWLKQLKKLKPHLGISDQDVLWWKKEMGVVMKSSGQDYNQDAGFLRSGNVKDTYSALTNFWVATSSAGTTKNKSNNIGSGDTSSYGDSNKNIGFEQFREEFDNAKKLILERPKGAVKDAVEDVEQEQQKIKQKQKTLMQKHRWCFKQLSNILILLGVVKLAVVGMSVWKWYSYWQTTLENGSGNPYLTAVVSDFADYGINAGEFGYFVPAGGIGVLNTFGEDLWRGEVMQKYETLWDIWNADTVTSQEKSKQLQKFQIDFLLEAEKQDKLEFWREFYESPELQKDSEFFQKKLRLRDNEFIEWYRKKLEKEGTKFKLDQWGIGLLEGNTNEPRYLLKNTQEWIQMQQEGKLSAEMLGLEGLTVGEKLTFSTSRSSINAIRVFQNAMTSNVITLAAGAYSTYAITECISLVSTQLQNAYKYGQFTGRNEEEQQEMNEKWDIPFIQPMVNWTLSNVFGIELGDSHVWQTMEDDVFCGFQMLFWYKALFVETKELVQELYMGDEAEVNKTRREMYEKIGSYYVEERRDIVTSWRRLFFNAGWFEYQVPKDFTELIDWTTVSYGGIGSGKGINKPETESSRNAVSMKKSFFGTNAQQAWLRQRLQERIWTFQIAMLEGRGQNQQMQSQNWDPNTEFSNLRDILKLKVINQRLPPESSARAYPDASELEQMTPEDRQAWFDKAKDYFIKNTTDQVTITVTDEEITDYFLNEDLIWFSEKQSILILDKFEAQQAKLQSAKEKQQQQEQKQQEWQEWEEVVKNPFLELNDQTKFSKENSKNQGKFGSKLMAEMVLNQVKAEYSSQKFVQQQQKLMELVMERYTGQFNAVISEFQKGYNNESKINIQYPEKTRQGFTELAKGRLDEFKEQIAKQIDDFRSRNSNKPVTIEQILKQLDTVHSKVEGRKQNWQEKFWSKQLKDRLKKGGLPENAGLVKGVGGDEILKPSHMFKKMQEDARSLFPEQKNNANAKNLINDTNQKTKTSKVFTPSQKWKISWFAALQGKIEGSRKLGNRSLEGFIKSTQKLAEFAPLLSGLEYLPMGWEGNNLTSADYETQKRWAKYDKQQELQRQWELLKKQQWEQYSKENAEKLLFGDNPVRIVNVPGETEELKTGVTVKNVENVDVEVFGKGMGMGFMEGGL